MPIKHIITFVGTDGSVESTKEHETPDAVPHEELVIPDEEIVEALISLLPTEDWQTFGRLAPRLSDIAGGWRDFSERVPLGPEASENIRHAFHALWTERGLWIREHVDADSTLLAALRALLPGYTGPSMILFRGQGIKPHELDGYGFSWSSSIAAAREFVKFHAASTTGAVLLQAIATPDAILAPPYDRSRRPEELEYVVDPSRLKDVRKIERA